MTGVIVFNGESGVAVMRPAPDTGRSVEDVAASDLEEGTRFIIVDESDLPANDPQSSWVIDFDRGVVTTDADKLHSIRVAEAEAEKETLVNEANSVIAYNNWTTKLALGRLDAAGKSLLNKWLDYIDSVMAVDTSAPPVKTWPTKPAS